MAKEPYRLPDKPSSADRPTREGLLQRLAKARQREARIQAGRDGKN
jgi:hypothetical protein